MSTTVREPRFIMPDGSKILFSLAPDEWLQGVVSGEYVYIRHGPRVSPGVAEAYAARLLRERQS